MTAEQIAAEVRWRDRFHASAEQAAQEAREAELLEDAFRLHRQDHWSARDPETLSRREFMRGADWLAPDPFEPTPDDVRDQEAQAETNAIRDGMGGCGNARHYL